MKRAVTRIYSENFWFWESVAYRTASSIRDAEDLMNRPLPQIAAWYLKCATTF